ncbi:MAG: DUF169 domain-containing protein [Proteobacteria bacterium]|nr:DUF169 domain-containing protein [Pseudomonadota bacterium]
MEKEKTSELNDLLEALGGAEEPFGMVYSDTLPDDCIRPKPGYLPTREQEEAGELDFEKLSRGKFSCVVQHIRTARRKKTAVALNKENFGCLGVAFYAGYQKEQLKMVERFVSTGNPGFREGEHYLESPEVCHRVLQQTNPRPAPAKYCVFRPLSQFADLDEPEVVVFFARPETLSGLQGLAVFVTSDIEAVMSPWGAGCSGMITWPVHYYAQGKFKAVTGGTDPSARKYLKYDELIFSVHRELFKLMLNRWPESFLKQHAWHTVKKRIRRTNRIWGQA